MRVVRLSVQLLNIKRCQYGSDAAFAGGRQSLKGLTFFDRHLNGNVDKESWTKEDRSGNGLMPGGIPAGEER